MNTFHSRCPEVRRTQEAITKRDPDVGVITYAREVVWLQESESQLIYRHGGKDFKESGTYTDHYGYLTSCTADSHRAALAAADWGITAQSSLELVVVTTVFLEPTWEAPEVLESRRHQSPRYPRLYAHVPREWGREVIEDGERLFKGIQREQLAREVVWSSKNTPEANARLLADFVARWHLPGASIEQAAA